MVAFTRLWGFDEPLLFASTFLMPTDSSTARMHRRHDTRTGSGRTNHHERAAETLLLLVGNRSVDYRDLHEVLLGILHALGDGCLHLRSLAQAIAYDAVLVTYDDDGRKTERATALRHLRNALDAHEAVLEFEIARAYFLYIGICMIV
mgnify:CR=1 FL=1